jgi:hypothetical protein
LKTLFKPPPALFDGLLVDFAYDFWCRLLDQWGELTGLGLIGDLQLCKRWPRGVRAARGGLRMDQGEGAHAPLRREGAPSRS